MRGNGRKVSADERIQLNRIAGDNQILQVNRAVEGAVVIADKEGGDVIVLLCLRNQRAHGLLDAEVAVDGDEIGRHGTADFIRPIGADKLDIVLRFRIELFNQRASQFGRYGFQRVNGVVGIHRFNDGRGVILRKLAQIFSGIADKGKYIADAPDAQQTIQTRTLMGIELLKRGGDIAFVCVGERDLKLFIGLLAVHQLDERVDTSRHIHDLFAHGFAFFHSYGDDEGAALRISAGNSVLLWGLGQSPNRTFLISSDTCESGQERAVCRPRRGGRKDAE